ncbi:PadR family transcriptional regulator [Nocardia sp. NPDC051052]|uniref:PadR family transcriptional regulator n=1 Tax=Nocardia sp. NPDC051052 TaxID=3364322 RepID=UPI003799AE08
MSAEALKGHLDGMILAVLAAGPRHGYGVIDSLRTQTSGRFDLPKGTIYPALHRLERAGLIDGRWSDEHGRRRRTYELTVAGKRRLGIERRSWQEFAAAVGALLDEEKPWPAT